MLKVQNQAKQTVSSELSLVVVVTRSDLQVAHSPNQKQNSQPPHRMKVPQGSLSLTVMHKLRQEQ
jgi:hypothetical protein